MGTDAPELTDWVIDTLAAGEDELPVFPGVAVRLLETLGRPDVELDEIEALIAQDQAIVAQLLRASNSVLYSPTSAIDDLSRAIRRLGSRETASIAMAAACRALFNLEDRVEREVFPELWTAAWRDALVCAFGARLLSRELSLGEPERIYVGAMLRDVGTLLILKVIARGLVDGRLPQTPSSSQIAEVVASQHAHVGGVYLRDSRLPDWVADVAQRHHDAVIPDSPEAMNLYLIRLADGLCSVIGTTPFASGELGANAEASARLTGLSPEQREYFEASFRELSEQLAELV